jgi:hypothetical protein
MVTATSPLAATTGEARNDDVKQRNDSVDDGGEDATDAVDDSHQHRADCSAYRFEL